MGGVLSHGRGAGTRWSLMFFPAQTILWFCEHQMTALGSKNLNYSLRPCAHKLASRKRSMEQSNLCWGPFTPSQDIVEGYLWLRTRSGLVLWMDHLLAPGTQQCVSVTEFPPQTLVVQPGTVPWYEPSPGGEEKREIYLKTSLPEWKCECRLTWMLSHIMRKGSGG